MAFHSILFVFTFLPIGICMYMVMPKRLKNSFLVILSLLFYAWGEPYYVFLLGSMIVVNYILAIRMDKGSGQQRKRYLIEAIAINICILMYFKYYGFLLKTIFDIVPIQVSYKVYTMPLGISFFTFSILSYLFDVYRHTCKSERNFINFALYVSFFPKLLVGPISRYKKFQTQFNAHAMSIQKLEKGASLFLCGLAQKVLLANTLAPIWGYTSSQNVSMIAAWIGMFAYTLQIYFDFQGYTLMAQGLGNIFGFEIERNFNYPYMAIGITDFWRRWHMTLSAWFKDYVYIPLGGNRIRKDKQIRNLLIVWCLTGLWHGAGWNFILWGLYYGLLLIIEKFVFHHAIEHIPKQIRWFITFVFVMIGWVLFASTTFSEAVNYYQKLSMNYGFIGNDVPYIVQNYGVYLLLGLIFMTPYPQRIANVFMKKENAAAWMLKPVASFLLFVIIISYMISDTYQSFLYFQF